MANITVNFSQFDSQFAGLKVMISKISNTKFVRIFFLFGLFLFISSQVHAQSNPGLVNGQIPVASQWNGYFAAKQDALGFTPLNSAGGTMTGMLATAASTTGATGLNLIPGVAPTSPNNGDVWVTTAGIYARINGVTIGPLISASTTDTFTNKTINGSSNTISNISLSADVSGSLPLSSIATIASNTVLGNATSGSAVPAAQAMPSCSTSASALNWTTNTGFGCNVAINAATLGGATFAAPGIIGGMTPAAATFTTETLTTVAPTVTSGGVGFGGTVAAATNCGSLAGAAGCLVINVAGTVRYVPYY